MTVSGVAIDGSPDSDGVTTNTAFDRTTERTVYVLSVVQSTASSIDSPLMNQLHKAAYVRV